MQETITLNLEVDYMGPTISRRLEDGSLQLGHHWRRYHPDGRLMKEWDWWGVIVEFPRKEGWLRRIFR